MIPLMEQRIKETFLPPISLTKLWEMTSKDKRKTSKGIYGPQLLKARKINKMTI